MLLPNWGSWFGMWVMRARVEVADFWRLLLLCSSLCLFGSGVAASNGRSSGGLNKRKSANLPAEIRLHLSVFERLANLALLFLFSVAISSEDHLLDGPLRAYFFQGSLIRLVPSAWNSSPRDIRVCSGLLNTGVVSPESSDSICPCLWGTLYFSLPESFQHPQCRLTNVGWPAPVS